MVLPILTYGSETWGYSNVKGIETVQSKFVKYVLHVNKSTPNFMVLGESGKLPVADHIQCKMINFWLRIINGSENKMVVKMYKVLHQKYIDNLYKLPWLNYIHKILINCGLGNIWAEHYKTSFNPKWLKVSVKQKLKDFFINSWCNDMYESNRGTIYREIKTKFEQESYLHQLPGSMSLILCKFRLSNFKLPIVRGRYNNIPRKQRFCDFCDENLLGDEFHILPTCCYHFAITTCTNLFNCSNSLVQIKGYLLNYVGFLNDMKFFK